ncbi:MAG TPA: tetraacyldisaccharide 4'-kinase [Bryobacteraceae bacterium]|nr:tetraacyldisaccharide 4'-kinase [Bryobacteraceae bacterium]
MSLSAAVTAVILNRTITATRLIFFLYQLLQIALTPAIALYLLYRGLRDRRYFSCLGERLALLPDSLQTTGSGAIWFHAVSVGEVLSIVELLRRLRAARPSVQLFVSTTTLAGRATAEQKLAGLADGVFYAPIDYRSTVRRVLRQLCPSLVVVLETEIWPNLYREAKRSGASLLIVNGRISDRALPRYRRWSWFFRHVLAQPDAILVQTEEDARRYVIAGAPPKRVSVGGNLKYDFTPPATGIANDISVFLNRTGAGNVWIAASTMPPAAAADVDEDDAVIDAFREVSAARPGLLLILAPRKPERFDIVAEKLLRAGVSFTRRTSLQPLSLPGVLLLDTIGELAAIFAVADVVFMGGTLAQRGGHNILEPAYFGKPIIVGPHMENFAAIAEEFHRAKALTLIRCPAELAGAVIQLLADGSPAGIQAREIARSKRGVTAHITEEIWEAFSEGVPSPLHKLPARVVLTPLSWIWRAGHRANVALSLAAQRSLATPVISIGGLTMGGVGKSPMVAHLAARLRQAGRSPAILTRGYKRKSAEPIVLIPRGEIASLDLTGDEAQMFLRAGDAHVGIGRNRYDAGLLMEQRFAPGVFLLDDGFQHLRLRRQQDIVLIDGLNPFGGGVFPIGRSREPAHGLRRATALVVTRAEPGQHNTGLERQLRRYSDAPVYRCRVTPRQWVDVNSTLGIPVTEAPFRKVAAFCGLGNPRSFWSTLEELKLDLVFHWAFGDHHSYRPGELQRLLAQAQDCGAEALVTTEKDALNLCDGATAVVSPLKLYWLKIGIEIEREEELLQQILQPLEQLPR